MTSEHIIRPDGTYLIVLDRETYDEFVELINRPSSGTPKLAELFATPAPWDDTEATQ